jgi:hypothetical protein
MSVYSGFGNNTKTAHIPILQNKQSYISVFKIFSLWYSWNKYTQTYSDKIPLSKISKDVKNL